MLPGAQWFENRANRRLHRGIRAVPAERQAEEMQRMRPLPERMPDTDRRFVMRVPQQPYLRFDTNDSSSLQTRSSSSRPLATRPINSWMTREKTMSASRTARGAPVVSLTQPERPSCRDRGTTQP